jgi:hypothetical protein
MGKLDRCEWTQGVAEQPARKARPNKEDLWGKVHLAWAAQSRKADAFLAAVIGYMVYRKGLTAFELPNTLFRQYGFAKNVKMGALARFERDEMIRVTRRGRRAPIVEVLPASRKRGNRPEKLFPEIMEGLPL